MSVHADSRVDQYIGQLPNWQQAICQQVRQLMHAADPEVEETIKRSVRPYFVLQGNICALLAAKDHVNVFIYDPTVADPPASSTKVTATRPPGPSRSTVATRSTVPPCWQCSGPSSRTTARAAGGASRLQPFPRRPEPITGDIATRRCAEMTMTSPGTIGSAGPRLHQRQPGT
jgi:hypothetical protein